MLNTDKINYNLSFVARGNINSYDGMYIELLHDKKPLGHINLITYRKAWDLDADLYRLYSDYDENCKSGLEEDFFDDHKSIFLYDLKIYKNYRGLGFGEKLFDKCLSIVEKTGAEFCLFITDIDNIIARNLYEKKGFQVHLSDSNKIMYFREV